VLPPGTAFGRLHSAEVAEDGSSVTFYIACTDGGIVALTLPIAEIEQRVIPFAAATHAPAGATVQ
jgi:hypothetical protein